MQLIAAWQPFYTLTGTAAATLIGLLFVAMSLHTETFRNRKPTVLEHFAALTFNCYFYVLLLSILFLIPRLSPWALGIPVVLLGVLGSANTFIQQRRIRNRPSEADGRSLAVRFTAPSIGLGALALIGIGIAIQVEASLYALVIVIVLLLGAASQNAWALLIVRNAVRSKEA